MQSHHHLPSPLPPPPPVYLHIMEHCYCYVMACAQCSFRRQPLSTFLSLSLPLTPSVLTLFFPLYLSQLKIYTYVYTFVLAIHIYMLSSRVWVYIISPHSLISSCASLFRVSRQSRSPSVFSLFCTRRETDLYVEGKERERGGGGYDGARLIYTSRSNEKISSTWHG